MVLMHFVKCFFVLMIALSCATSLPFGAGKLRYTRSMKIDEEYDDDIFDNTTSSRIVNEPKQDSDTIDDTPQILNKTKNVPKPLEKVDNVGSAVISSATNIFGSLFGIASRILDVKAEATVEGIGIASRTAEDIANSNTAGKFVNATLKAGGVAVEGIGRLGGAIIEGSRVGIGAASRTVDAIANSKTTGKIVDASINAGRVAVEGTRRVGETVVEGSRIIGQEASKAAEVGIPIVLNAGIATANGLEDLARLKICIFLCPLQGGKEKQEKCRKDNCEKKDRSDGIDYYDGDFRGFDY